MEYEGPYAPGPIAPIVKPGQNVMLADLSSYKLYMVSFVEPIPRSSPLVFNTGGILGSATTTPQDTAAILNMQDGQLGQFRAEVLDDIVVQVNQPNANGRFRLRGPIATLNIFSAIYDPDAHLTETYVYDLGRPFLVVNNPSAAPILRARIVFWGFRYQLEGASGIATKAGELPPIATYSSLKEADRTGVKYTVVPINAR